MQETKLPRTGPSKKHKEILEKCEKGKQPGYRSAGRPDWVRLEVQVRPQKTARKAYSPISADDTWGASPWTRKIALRAFSLDVGAFPAGGVRKDSDFDRRSDWVCNQAAPTLLEAKIGRAHV